MTTHPEGSAILEDPPNPGIAEVQQETYPGPALLVAPNGPWPITAVPARHGVAFTEILTLAADIRKILSGPDEKRKRVFLTTDADIFVSFTGAQGSGMRLHGAAAVQGTLEITYIGPIYIRIAADGTANVGVLVEYWAD